MDVIGEHALIGEELLGGVFGDLPVYNDAANCTGEEFRTAIGGAFSRHDLGVIPFISKEDKYLFTLHKEVFKSLP